MHGERWLKFDRNFRVGIPLHCPLHLSTSSKMHLCLKSVFAGASKQLAQETDESVNLVEVKIVLIAVIAFQEKFFAEALLFMADNATVVVYINKQDGTLSQFVPAHPGLQLDGDSFCSFNSLTHLREVNYFVGPVVPP